MGATSSHTQSPICFQGCSPSSLSPNHVHNPLAGGLGNPNRDWPRWQTTEKKAAKGCAQGGVGWGGRRPGSWAAWPLSHQPEEELLCPPAPRGRDGGGAGPAQGPWATSCHQQAWNLALRAEAEAALLRSDRASSQGRPKKEAAPKDGGLVAPAQPGPGPRTDEPQWALISGHRIQAGEGEPPPTHHKETQGDTHPRHSHTAEHNETYRGTAPLAIPGTNIT